MCNGPERAVECIHKPVTVFAKILKGGGDNEPCYLGLRRRERTESVLMEISIIVVVSHVLSHPLMLSLPKAFKSAHYSLE